MTEKKDIQLYGKLIAEKFSPEKIILFGSYAYGKPTNDSDVDLPIVMRHSGDSKNAAFTIKNSLPRQFPLDLIVRSPEELRLRLAKNDFFIQEILDRGTVIYERSN